MDYDELKKKYGGSERPRNGGIRMEFLVGALLAIAAGVVFYFIYFPKYNVDYSSNAVLRELESLSPDRETVDVITTAACTSLDKSDEYWLVDACKDDVYFKLYLAENGGYTMTFCYQGSTPLETFMKVKDYVGRECVEVPGVGGPGYSLIKETTVTKTYNVCGNKVIFINECLAGIGSL